VVVSTPAEWARCPTQGSSGRRGLENAVHVAPRMAGGLACRGLGRLGRAPSAVAGRAAAAAPVRLRQAAPARPGKESTTGPLGLMESGRTRTENSTYPHGFKPRTSSRRLSASPACAFSPTSRAQLDRGSIEEWGAHHRRRARSSSYTSADSVLSRRPPRRAQRGGDAAGAPRRARRFGRASTAVGSVIARPSRGPVVCFRRTRAARTSRCRHRGASYLEDTSSGKPACRALRSARCGDLFAGVGTAQPPSYPPP